MSTFAPLQRQPTGTTTTTATTASYLSQRVPVPEMLQPPQVEAPASVQTGGKPAAHFSLADLPIHAPEQRSASLPDPLKTTMERLSSLSLDDVKVHYDSLRPLQVGASAYTQGAQIHLGPGQERYLPHEAWHAVQQKQRRVAPNLRLSGGEVINDEKALEQEADEMAKQARRGADKPFSDALRTAPHAAPPQTMGVQPIQRKIIIADDLALLLKVMAPDIMDHSLYKHLDLIPDLIYIQQSDLKNDTSVRTDLNKDTFEDKLPVKYKNKNIRYIINLHNTEVQKGMLPVDAESRLKAFEPKLKQEEKQSSGEGTSQGIDPASLSNILKDIQFLPLPANLQQPVLHQSAPQQSSEQQSEALASLMDTLRKIALIGQPKDPYEGFSPETRKLLTQADELLERSRRQPFPRFHRLDPELERIPTGNIPPTGNVAPTSNVNPTINISPTQNIIPPTGNVTAQTPAVQKHEALSLHTVLLHEMGHVEQFLRSKSPFAQGKDVEEIDETSLPLIPDNLLTQTQDALGKLNPKAPIWSHLADLNRVVQVWLTTLEDFFSQKGKENLKQDVKEAQGIGELVGARAQVWLEYDVITNVEHPEALKRGEAIRHIHGVEGTVNDPNYKNFEVAKKTIEQTRAMTLKFDPQSLPDLQQRMLQNAFELTQDLPGLLKTFLGLITSLKQAVEKLKK